MKLKKKVSKFFNQTPSKVTASKLEVKIIFSKIITLFLFIFILCRSKKSKTKFRPKSVLKKIVCKRHDFH